MYCNKVGIHFPGNSEEATRFGGDENPEEWGLYNPYTHMHYELWDSSGELVLGAFHDSVGLVTFYDIDKEYWERLSALATGLTKPAKDLTEGDMILHGDYDEVWTTEVVDVDPVEGVVWVDFDSGQDTFANDSIIAYHPKV